MTNPVFSSSPVFGDPNNSRVRDQRRTMQSDPSWGSPAYPVMDAASLEAMYTSPSANTAQTGRMTYDDVIVRTGALLGLLVVVAAISWFLTPFMPFLYILGAVVGLVLGLVNSFKRNPSPVLIVLYAIAEGMFLGGISWLFQNMLVPGTADGTAAPVVMQAVLGTFVTFGAALLLFRSGKVRVTPKFTRWLMIAIVGYAGFSLVNLVLSFFIHDGAFGPLRQGVWGILAGVIAVGLAAASLIVDFDAIKRGVEDGVPAKFAWTASFGLLVTLVWLYLELLRLFTILAGRD